MKVSHEVPRCLLEDSKNFNDYQYCLVHLMEEDKVYREHFLQCRDEGIPIYLDNSLHELGTAIGGEVLMKWIDKLKPKYVFVPDVWEDKDASIVNARKWIGIKLPEEVEKVAVIQAKSIHEAATCYQTYKDLGYEKIAFSYGAEYFKKLGSGPESIAQAQGRFAMISTLYYNNVISDNDNVHLLGCAVPQEFSWYKGYKFIKSIDTSNPIMAALEGLKYESFGLFKKPQINMNQAFNIDPKDVNIDLLYYNIESFKKLVD